MYDNDKTSLVLENQKLQKELERQKVYETNARENIEMLGKYFFKNMLSKVSIFGHNFFPHAFQMY